MFLARLIGGCSMNKPTVVFDFMDHQFECVLSLEEIKEDKTAIYRLKIDVSPIPRVAFGYVYHSVDEILVTFDDYLSFGFFGGEISTKIVEELKAVGF